MGLRQRIHAYVVPLGRVGVGTALLIAMSCGGGREAPPGQDRVGNAASVILVVVDTLRADHLGLYGYARPTSPNLDAWATHGRVFDHAFAPAPWTLPSFASIYTGRWPLIHQAGLADPLDRPAERLALGPIEDLPQLAETLRAEGYRTLAVATNPYLAPSFGVARGFDVYDLDIGASDGLHRPAEEVVQRALKLVDDVDGQPFFLVVHMFDPHMDFNAPPPFGQSFTASIRSVYALPFVGFEGRRINELAPQDLQFITAAYDEEIAYVDDQLGVLRDGLAERGLLEKSVVFLTSDHGEELFDHGDFEHGHTLYQELLHVPLVVWGPGIEPGRESDPVSLVDIAPTVLDRLGIAPPAPFDGISLWPNLSASVPLPERPLFAEGLTRGPPQSAVVRWPHKLVVNHLDGLIDVFDLVQDPHERISRAAGTSDIPQTLIADLCRHQRSAEDGGRAPDRTAATPGQDVLERLRSLGYIRVNTETVPQLRDRQFPCYADSGAGPVVHVRWVEALGDTERMALERSLGLYRAEHHEGTTWKYRVPEVSPDRLRAIVAHEMVEDTNGFDRTSLELDAPATR